MLTSARAVGLLVSFQGRSPAGRRPHAAAVVRLPSGADWRGLHQLHPWPRSLSSILCLKIAKIFANFLQNVTNFVKISLEFVDFRADFYQNFIKACRINKNCQISAENCGKLSKIVIFELDLS